MIKPLFVQAHGPGYYLSKFNSWLEEILNPEFVFLDENTGLYCRENVGEWTTSLDHAKRMRGETYCLQTAGRLSIKLKTTIKAVRVPRK